MSKDYQRIEVITEVARRSHWSTVAKLRIIGESFEPAEIFRAGGGNGHCLAYSSALASTF